jgi:hypothetical protein
MTVAREIVEEEGITGLWSGLRPGLVLTVNPAITYGMFERVKSLVLLTRGKFGSNGKMSPWLSFLVGALSKTLATIVCVSVMIEYRFSISSRSRIHISWPRLGYKLGLQT